MSQMGRQLETPRPLKTSIKQLQSYQQQSFEVNSGVIHNREVPEYESIDVKFSF